MVFNEHGHANGPSYDAPREMQDLPAGQAVSLSYLHAYLCPQLFSAQCSAE